MRRFAPLMGVVLILWFAGCDRDSSPNRKRKEDVPPPNQNFPAHEVEGTDSAGKPLRLSDYKGKVILLDFWANWCRPCMALVPHEKELVKSLEGKPFVLLGVSADRTLEDLKTTEEEQRINWRSWWDERGSLRRQWDVRVLPTLFLIDHNGLVRYRFEGGGPTTEEDLEAAIKDLVRKAGGDN